MGVTSESTLDQVMGNRHQWEPVKLVHIHGQRNDAIATLGTALDVRADAVGRVRAEFADDVFE